MHSMMRRFRIVLLVILFLALYSTPGFAQAVVNHQPQRKMDTRAGMVEITLPAAFFNPGNEKNNWLSLVSPVGRVYDTLIDLKQVAITENNKGSLKARVHMHVGGASGLILYFKKLVLPADAILYIDAGSKGISERIDRQMLTGGPFSLPITEGESVDLIWELPENQLNDLAAELSGVGVVLYPENTTIGGSGACEVNVNCEEGNAWKDQRDAVVRILVRNQQSVYWCTGVLVNNTARDKTPYILTANHCGKGATSENLAQWQFFFNYEADECPNPIVEPEKKMTIGGRKKAASDGTNGSLGSDFYLLTLLQGIPAGARAYFSGWSRMNEAAEHGVCIHHPQGDLKKISTFTTPAVSSNWESSPGTHWKVVWAATANGHGVTEGGSSGSPLFNPEGLLVGTLTGGQASCDSASLNQPDYFGKFSYHWDANGLADTLRLSPFLDPLNTGVVTLEGTPLAIEKKFLPDNPIQIVPNPVAGGFSLSGLPASAGALYPVRVSVFDVSGRLILEGNLINPLSDVFRVDDLTCGVYVVKIELNRQVLFLKMVKK